jgi:hypothetical protein
MTPMARQWRRKPIILSPIGKTEEILFLPFPMGFAILLHLHNAVSQEVHLRFQNLHFLPNGFQIN